MSILFKPISWSDGDIKSYKYMPTNSIREGQFVTIKANTTLSPQGIIAVATRANGKLPKQSGTTFATTMANIYKEQGRHFPVYIDRPDPENISATILSGDYVLGFHGSEYEIHKSQCERPFASTFQSGSYVTLGSNHKLTVLVKPAGGRGVNSTGLIVGQVLGTINGWIRIRKV